jgi:thiamine-phosphate pyrophosphorylase
MINIYRTIDANLNRIAEGLRVVEDISRFHFEHPELAKELKNFRHAIRKKFIHMESKLTSFRDVQNDIGKEISSHTKLDNKTNLKQLATSNFKRIEEGLRTVEEHLKILGDYQGSKAVEKLRFTIYETEKRHLGLFRTTLPAGTYGITAEKLSKGRKNIAVIKEMIEGGVTVVQYREKLEDKSLREIYQECREVRKMTADNGVMFIVNDYVDIAMLVDADGIHLGQDDLPVKEVRRLSGDKIIGLSTHSPEQAQKAVKDGADYIGVGPIFKTDTKKKVCDPVGIEYLEYVSANVSLPFVAIGGIKENNIREIQSKGAKTIALVSEIVGADNIANKVKKINKIMNQEGKKQ